MMFFLGKPVAEPNSNAIQERRTMARANLQLRLARPPSWLRSCGYFLRHCPDRLVCGAMSWDSCSCALELTRTTIGPDLQCILYHQAPGDWHRQPLHR